MEKIMLEDFIRYRQLKKECERMARRIKSLQRRQGEAVADKVSASLPHFPYTQGGVKIVGVINNAQRICELERRLQSDMAEARILLGRLKEFLRGVEDFDVRDTLVLYYLEGLRYRDIPKALGLEGNGTTQMKAAHRFFNKYV